MSALEREIVEKFRQLQPTSKQRVRMIIDQQADAEAQQAEAFDFAVWLESIDDLRQQIRDSHGGNLPAMDVVGMLRDIRDGEDE